MSFPNLVDEVLTYVTDGGGTNENWDTSNRDPAPVPFNRDTRTRKDTGNRVKGVDLTDSAVISADSSPTRSNTLIGAGFDYRGRVGVGVRIEGLHSDAGGTISDDADWRNLVDEAKRAIHAERNFPTSHPMLDLRIEEEDSGTPSPDQNEWQDFRYDFTVWFHGFESLP